MGSSAMWRTSRNPEIFRAPKTTVPHVVPPADSPVHAAVVISLSCAAHLDQMRRLSDLFRRAVLTMIFIGAAIAVRCGFISLHPDQLRLFVGTCAAAPTKPCTKSVSAVSGGTDDARRRWRLSLSPSWGSWQQQCAASAMPFRSLSERRVYLSSPVAVSWTPTFLYCSTLPDSTACSRGLDTRPHAAAAEIQGRHAAAFCPRRVSSASCWPISARRHC